MKMTRGIEYPLEDVLEVKKKRVEAAERHVKEMQQALKKEQDKLREVEAARDKVKQHLADKVKQYNDALDEGTTSDEIEMMQHYMEVVEERLEAENKKVKAQQEQVEIAEKNLHMAKEELRLRRKEVDKLEEHKTSYLKVAKKELEIEEAKEQDEIGNVLYLGNRLKRKKLEGG